MLGFLLYALNMTISCLIVLVAFPLSFIPPVKRFVTVMPLYWAKTNLAILKLTTQTQLDIQLPSGLSTQKSYIVTANHQSWADIIILFDAFSGHIPMLKFFLKQQLKWVPFVGLSCWIYGFPFLYRHTAAELKKHPEWKQRDLLSTRKACERFKSIPGSLMVFAEGTRFTKAKQKKQQSPYQHLLKPKAGGIATALQHMGEHITSLIDVTIIYPKHSHSFLDFCRGNIKKITVIAKEIPLTPELRGDYENNPEYRRDFQRFLNNLWAQKDEVL
jgi:1-acyl-sn-glycerol-3-phosphate acyltransferase